MATISSLGIGSGLDSESIITKLVALEKQPLQNLQIQQKLKQARITAFGQVQSQFAALSDAAKNISQATAWKTTKASSSNPTAATITSTSIATPQSFSLDVDKLALKQNLTSIALASNALVGAGTLAIRLGTWSNTGGAASAAAALAAANAAFTSAQNALTAATNTQNLRIADLAAADAALATADADLVAPTATRDAAALAYAAADAIYQPLKADQTAKQSVLTAALTAYNSASTAVTNASTALTNANTNLASATTASTNANSTLTTAVSSLATAQANSVAANSALGLADAALASANNGLSAANTSLTNATASLTSANDARDTALAADASAKASLNSFVSTDPGALADPKAAAYALAYGNWVDAVATSASSFTQANLDAVATRKAELENARASLAASSPSVLAAANVITAPADASDASALIVGANSAQAAVTAANAAVAAATAQQATATTNRSTAFTDAQTAASTLIGAENTHAIAFSAANAATTALSDATAAQASASAAKTAADAALVTATAARDVAQSDLDAATAALVAPTADRASAQSDLDAANAALAPLAAARTTALNNQTAATAAKLAADTDVSNASAAVTAANAQVAAANSGVSSATPVFTAAGGSADITVTATASDTISSLVAKINQANAGVVASVFTDGSNQRLVLTAKNTGEAAGFRIQATDDDANNTDSAGLSRFAFDPSSGSFGLGNSGVTAQYGQDAQVRINGVVATSATNTFANSISGVTINVQATTTTGFGTGGEVRNSATMAVSEDVTPAVKSVNDFVKAYNALISNLREITKYDAATKTPSAFQGDSSVVGLLNVLRGVTGSISTGSAYQRLSDVGIQVQSDGTLGVDTAKLSVAANNADELSKLFITDNKNAQTNGFALKFSALAQGVLAASGAVTNKAKALDKELLTNATEQQRINTRAASVEARLRKQYSALDARMGSLNALGAYVSQQVTQWNKSTG